MEDITAETSEMIFFQLPFYIDVEQFCVRIRPRWPGWKVLDHDVWLVGATVRVDDIDLAALLREVQTAVSELHLDAIRYCLDGRFYIMEGVRLEGTTHVVRSIPDRQAV